MCDSCPRVIQERVAARKELAWPQLPLSLPLSERMIARRKGGHLPDMPLDLYDVQEAEGWTTGDSVAAPVLRFGLPRGVITRISWDTEKLKWIGDVDFPGSQHAFWVGPLSTLQRGED